MPKPQPRNTYRLFTPPSAVAVMQLQSDANDVPDINVLLAAIDEVRDDVFDDVLASQTPIMQSPTQPIIAATTQFSPSLQRLKPMNLFCRSNERKNKYHQQRNGQVLAKK